MKSTIPAMQRLLNSEEFKLTRMVNSVNTGTREYCYNDSISVKI